MSASFRAAIVWLLLAIETLITAPIFAVSWLVSAIGLAVVGGYRFASLQSDAEKRKILNTVLGGKADA